jgi:PIN domain nuclease of toxin-antitoxin system
MILMDTQAASWLATRPQRLSRRAVEAVRRASARDGLAVASVTLMELAQMIVAGKIQTGVRPTEWLRRFVDDKPFAVIEVSIDIAAVAAHLPPTFPSDPFDRLIAATAIVERMPLITSDARIHKSGVVRTIW